MGIKIRSKGFFCVCFGFFEVGFLYIILNSFELREPPVSASQILS